MNVATNWMIALELFLQLMDPMLSNSLFNIS